MMEDPLSTRRYEDQECYRLIPSRFPPIDVYEDVATPDQLEAIWAIEAITNPRLEQQAGRLSVVPKDEWLVGVPNASYVMGAFTHLHPQGARFSTGEFGAYYAAPELQTAIAETVYHQARRLSYTNEPATEVDMRCLVARFSAELVDVTGERFDGHPLYHDTDYSAGQQLARQLKQDRMDGLVYRSVRREGHECFAIFKPCLFSYVNQAAHFSYVWNGKEITHVYKKSLDLNSPY